MQFCKKKLSGENIKDASHFKSRSLDRGTEGRFSSKYIYSTMYYLYRVSQHNMGNFDWLLQVQKGKYAEPFKKKYPGKNASIYEVKLDCM